MYGLFAIGLLVTLLAYSVLLEGSQKTPEEQQKEDEYQAQYLQKYKENKKRKVVRH